MTRDIRHEGALSEQMIDGATRTARAERLLARQRTQKRVNFLIPVVVGLILLGCAVKLYLFLAV